VRIIVSLGCVAIGVGGCVKSGTPQPASVPAKAGLISAESVGSDAFHWSRDACTADGWCADSTPHFGYFNDVQGVTQKARLAVGSGGWVARFDGSDWQFEHSGWHGRLNAIHGTGDNLYAVGSFGAVLHRVGDQWERLDFPKLYEPTFNERRSLYSVWADAESVVVAGSKMVARRRNETWEDVLLPEGVTGASEVWGRGDELWIGTRDKVFHTVDGGWSEPRYVTDFRAFCGNKREVFAVGDRRIHRFDGISWTASPYADEKWRDVSCPESGTAIAVGKSTFANNAGEEWAVVGEGPADVRAVWGQSDDVVAVGKGLSHFDGTHWTTVQPESLGAAVKGVFGVDGRIFAVGDEGRIYERRDSGWRLSYQLPEVPREADDSYGRVDYLNKMWGPSADHLWVVGTNKNLLEFKDGAWFQRTSGELSLDAIWGLGEDLAYAVGTDVLQWNGRQWSPLTLPVNPGLRGFNGVWGTSADDVWVVGDDALLHFDGVTWSNRIEGFEVIPPDMKNREVVGVWGSATDDIFFAMHYGVLHFDGTIWTFVATLDMGRDAFPERPWQSLYDIHGAATDAVWVVGQHGFVAHWNGQMWRRELSGTDTLYQGVWVGVDAVYATGTNGVIRRPR